MADATARRPEMAAPQTTHSAPQPSAPPLNEAKTPTKESTPAKSPTQQSAEGKAQSKDTQQAKSPSAEGKSQPKDAQLTKSHPPPTTDQKPILERKWKPSDIAALHPSNYLIHGLILAGVILYACLGLAGWMTFRRPAVIALGPHGAGKSLLGNVLANRNAFRVNQDISAEPKQYKSTALPFAKVDYLDAHSLLRNDDGYGFNRIKDFVKRENRANGFLIVLNSKSRSVAAEAAAILEQLFEAYGDSVLEHIAFVFTHVSDVSEARKDKFIGTAANALMSLGHMDASMPEVFAFDLDPHETHADDEDFLHSMQEWNSEELQHLKTWIKKQSRFDVKKIKPAESSSTGMKNKAQDLRKNIKKHSGDAEDAWEDVRGKASNAGSKLRHAADEGFEMARDIKGRVRRTVADAHDEVQHRLHSTNTFRRIVQAVKSKLFGRKGISDTAEHLKEGAKEKGQAASRIFGAAQERVRNVGESIRHSANEAAEFVGETGDAIQRQAGVARHKVGELYDHTVESLSETGHTVQQTARDARKVAQRKAAEAQDYAKKSVKETRDFLLDKAQQARDVVEQGLEKAHIIKPVKKNLWQKIFG